MILDQNWRVRAPTLIKHMTREKSEKSSRALRPGKSGRATSNPSLHRRFWILAGLLVVANLIAYSDSFHASWHFDDQSNILSNRSVQIRDLSWQSLHAAWSSRIGGRRPVSYLSFALNYYISRFDVFSYHVVNFCIHAIISILVFFLLWLLADRCSPLRSPQQRQSLAFLAACLWSLHPIQTQSVTYIVQRMNSLSTLFLLAAFILYVQLRSAKRSAVRIVYLISFLTCILLACLSKENAYILPLALVVYEFFFVFRWEFLKARAWKLFAVCLVLAVLSVAVLYGPGAIKEVHRNYLGRDFTMRERLLTEARVVVFYFSLLITPFLGRQALHHEIEKSTSLLHPWTTLPSFLLIGAAIVASIGLKNRRPLYGFLGLWYFVFLAIESSFWPLEMIFEHRLYLPSIGVIAILVFSGAELFQYSASHHRRIIFNIFVLGISTGLVWLTFNRNKAWEESFTLWQDNLSKYPRSYRAQNNFGVACIERGNLQLAEVSFLEAVRLKPDFDEARCNLALLFLNSGRNAEALRWAEEVHQQNLPPSAFYNLGTVYSKLGDYPKAIDCYRNTLARNPFNAGAYFNLGLAWLKVGNTAMARESFEGFLRVWNGDAESPYVQEARRQLQELAGAK